MALINDLSACYNSIKKLENMGDHRAHLYYLYDDTCELCVRFKEWVEDRDMGGVVAAVPLTEEGLQERFPMVDFKRAAKELTACDRRGEVYVGAAALRVLGRHLPGLERLDWIYQLPGVQVVFDRVYRTVDRVRKRLCLSCGDAWMPSKKYGQRRRRGGRR